MGSTFKPITVAMGYDKNLISPGVKFDVTQGQRGPEAENVTLY